LAGERTAGHLWIPFLRKNASHPEGIRNGKVTLSWDALDHITLYGFEDGLLPKRVPYADAHSLVERMAWWQEEVLMDDTMLITGKNELRPFWSLKVSKVPNALLLMELADYALRQRTH
jgi:hypothetical protein